MASRKVVKMLGPAGWAEHSDLSRGQVTRAILQNGTRFVIDLECGRDRYSVTLDRQSGDHFAGSWSYQSGGQTITGSASGELYKSQAGSLLLGDWVEDGVRHRWWLELCVVEHFPDEAPG
jgi:hypothetical protein